MKHMDAKKKLGEGHAGESDLYKVARMPEENGFYVVHADFGLTSGEQIRAYPKRTVSVEIRPDTSIQA
jgi:hypothetical protein